jgi:MFS transporter, MHS family, proline/betaine transporter
MGIAAVGIPVDAATRRKAVVAATIGNFVGWYDFIIYGYFATVIAAQFFPYEDPLAGVLATFAVFGGVAPLIFTYLLQRVGNPIAPAFYILGAGIISVLAAITIAETAGRPLADT